MVREIATPSLLPDFECAKLRREFQRDGPRATMENMKNCRRYKKWKWCGKMPHFSQNCKFLQIIFSRKPFICVS